MTQQAVHAQADNKDGPSWETGSRGEVSGHPSLPAVSATHQLRPRTAASMELSGRFISIFIRTVLALAILVL